MTSRDELRSFGANLVLGADALFFGASFFIYVYRRQRADAWADAWSRAEWARLPFFAAVALLAIWPLLYRKGREPLSVAIGLLVTACLFWAGRAGFDLVLPGGSRAALIALGFFSWVFGVHALALAAAGWAARGSPIFRRFLWTQAGFALLILPLVFCW